MAVNKKITECTALTAPATGDLVPIVDISDTTDSANGTTKKITLQNLFKEFFGQLTLSGHASFSLSTNQNNWNPSTSNLAVILLNITANIDITGLTAPASVGRLYFFVNIGTNTVTFKNLSGSSSANNQFQLQADLAVPPGGSAIMWYYTTGTKWYCLGNY